MNFSKRIILFFALSVGMLSCKKNPVETVELGGVVIANVVAGGPTVKLGSYTTNLSNSAAGYYHLLSGNKGIYVYPLGDSLHPYYNSINSLTVTSGDLYTLFLAGPLNTVEPILIKETVTRRTDETMAI